MKHNIGIYCITNLINDKKYIGQSCNLIKRFSAYRCGTFSSKHLKSAVKKYGWINFKICPIIYCNINDLDYYETLLIEKLDLTNPSKGYNSMTGGCKIKKHSAASIQRMREAGLRRPKGKDHWMFGRKMSEEAKQKMREAQANRPKGYKRSQEICEKISKGLIGKKLSKESIEKRQKIREINRQLGLHKKTNKYIVGIHIETNEKIFFKGVQEAKQKGFTNCDAVLYGHRNHCKEYFFRYATQEEISFYTKI